MEASIPTQKSHSSKDSKHEEAHSSSETYQKHLELMISTLPRENGWITEHLYHYQGFWYHKPILEGIVTVQQHFKTRPTDVLLITTPKSGTTWFKALLFAIMNRNLYHFDTHPLLTKNPHECVPFLEVYAKHHSNILDLPLLSTHIPYTSLPKSILDSGCRIVYVFRDLKDMFVSLWHFVSKLRMKEMPLISIEDAFDQFCKGVSPCGPFWDHVLGYWRVSVECPDRVLFLKYEDLNSEPFVIAKRLAVFLGHPFSSEEESEGVVHKIVELCSFENMSKLEVNKIGFYTEAKPLVVVQNCTFFRQGKVGDSKNYLPSVMMKCVDQITNDKLKDLL